MNEKNDNAKAILIENIKQYRRAQGLTQEKLAESAGLNSIADIEGGRSNPNLSTIIKIARSLNVEVWELFYDRKTMTTLVSQVATKQLIKDLVDKL